MASATVITLPHLLPPFVHIEGVINCRSLPIPRGSNKPFLYRSGNISKITATGIIALKALNIKTIFDFRSPGDVAQYESANPVMAGVEIISAPLFIEEEVQKEKVADWTRQRGEQYEDPTLKDALESFQRDERKAFMDLYNNKILKDGKAGIQKVLKRILERKEDESILFHCSGGKDRTGVVAALLLQLAGVDEETIAHDYGLTAIGCEPYREFFLQRYEKMKAFQENREGGMNMFSSKPETMRAFLVGIQELYGGAEGYVRQELGFNEEEVSRLKAALSCQN